MNIQHAMMRAGRYYQENGFTGTIGRIFHHATVAIKRKREQKKRKRNGKIDFNAYRAYQEGVFSAAPLVNFLVWLEFDKATNWEAWEVLGPDERISLIDEWLNDVKAQG